MSEKATSAGQQNQPQARCSSPRRSGPDWMPAVAAISFGFATAFAGWFVIAKHRCGDIPDHGLLAAWGALSFVWIAVLAAILVRARKQRLESDRVSAELRSANERLSAHQQQLVAANQQLRAAEQQLRAHETALRESEQTYRMLFNGMVSAYAILEPIPDAKGEAGDFRIVRVNPAFGRETGINSEESLNRTFQDLLAPSEWEARRKQFQIVMETGESAVFEVHSAVSGQWYAASVFRLKPGTLGVTFLNITARKRFEEILLNTARGVSGKLGDSFFRSLAQHLHEALKADYVCIARMAPETPGVARTVVFCVDGRVADNISYALAGTPCERAFESDFCLHARQVAESYPNDTTLREMGISGYGGMPVRDSAGRTLGILSVMYKAPIPEPELVRMVLTIFASRVGAELERQQAMEELKTRSNAIETSSNAILFLDLDGKVTYVNESFCGMWQYSRGAAVGLPFASFWRTESDALAIIGETRGRQTWVGERVARRSDDSLFHARIYASAVRDDAGQIRCYMAAVADITTERNAEQQREQLVQADKMISLGTLVAGVAHEINNPTAYILLNAPLLSDVWSDATPILREELKRKPDLTLGGMDALEAMEQMPSLLDSVVTGARRIKHIVSDLKSYARLAPASVTDPVNVNQIVEASVKLLGSQIRRATRRFSCELAVNLPVLKGNPMRLEQVVVNLIQNACEALPSPDRGISVETRYLEEAGSVVIYVRDEGTGISEEDLPHVTDPFFTTKRERGGTGLGLSVSLGIVRDHGGTLNFSSTQGKGTTAVVVLPAEGIASARS